MFQEVQINSKCRSHLTCGFDHIFYIDNFNIQQRIISHTSRQIVSLPIISLSYIKGKSQSSNNSIIGLFTLHIPSDLQEWTWCTVKRLNASGLLVVDIRTAVWTICKSFYSFCSFRFLQKMASFTKLMLNLQHCKIRGMRCGLRLDNPPINPAKAVYAIRDISVWMVVKLLW